MGASNGMLLRMILLQALVVGVIGYGLGVGGAALFGMRARRDSGARRSTCRWQLLGVHRRCGAGDLLLACAGQHAEGAGAGAGDGVQGLMR